MEHRQRLRYAALLIFAYLLLSGTYSLVTPAYESPDEVGHFAYIVQLLSDRSLPVQKVGALGEAHQPPLYYAVAALAASPADLKDQTGKFRPNPQFIWAGRGGSDASAGLHGSAETFPFRGYALALHLARAASVLMGAVTVAVAIAIGWMILPAEPVIGLLAGALIAFNPQFLFISGSVNNDNLLTALTTLGVWKTLQAMRQPQQRRHWMLAGTLAGTGFLAKVNGGLLIGLVAGLGLLISAVRYRSIRMLVDGALTMVIATALLSGWWAIRNQMLYGDPAGWGVYREVFAANLRSEPLQWSDVSGFFSGQFRSYWGVFGWMTVFGPDWFDRLYQALCLLGLVGLGIRGIYARIGGERRRLENAASIVVALSACMFQEAYMLAVITQCNASCNQGRYLFPAIAPLAILLSWGLTGLVFPLRRELARALVSGAVALGLAAVSVYVPIKVIAPRYSVIPIPTWRLWLVPSRTDYDFSGTFRLRGYDISKADEASAVTLTLYWQASQRPDFDYSAFVHLIDLNGQLVAQKDHAPGESRGYLPTAWQPGDIIVDEHRLELAPQLPAGTYRFRVGMYNWATGAQLPVTLDGAPLGGFVILDRSVQH